MGKMSLKGRSYSILTLNTPRVGNRTQMDGGIITEVYAELVIIRPNGDIFAYYTGEKPKTVSQADGYTPSKVHWFGLIPQGCLLIYDE